MFKETQQGTPFHLSASSAPDRKTLHAILPGLRSFILVPPTHDVKGPIQCSFFLKPGLDQAVEEVAKSRIHSGQVFRELREDSGAAGMEM